jgi:hypothetical protein
VQVSVLLDFAPTYQQMPPDPAHNSWIPQDIMASLGKAIECWSLTKTAFGAYRTF